MRIRRKNVAWLTILGALVAVALLSGVATPVQAAALLALYGAALAASMLDVKPAKLIDTVQRSSLTRMRMSPQAQEAVARAQRRGSYVSEDLTLLDIGLIAAQSTAEGMVMRRTRQVSKDDDGMRPFITLHVQPTAADTTSVIRFEIIDHNGDQQYVHEMKTYLRDGEMNILADHQLPLDGNDRLNGAGDGDLRVYVDGNLLGALSFTLAPSMRERSRQMNRAHDADDAHRRLEDTDREVPMSLEDLLRSRSQDDRSR
jgi:hypothetical protein